MSEDRNSPPQYIVTTPSEVDAEEEERSLQENTDAGEVGTDAGKQTKIKSTTTTKVISQSIQKQMKKTSRITSMASSTSHSIESMLADSTITEPLQKQQLYHQERSEIQQSSSQVTFTKNSIASLKPASKSEEEQTNLMAAQLDQQVKAHSSTSMIMHNEQQIQQQQQRNIMQKISLVSSQQQNTKTKFQSFLQQPEAGGSNYLTAHQKHVRQFVRSTSAHSEATTTAAVSGAIAMQQKCTRSSSTQNDGTETNAHLLGLQHTSSVLLSKSAETIEMKTSSAGMRTGLTLSGGFLAPPNRKITILSPIHAPAGLHDMLKRAGRSPLSPRISFPGHESDLFG